MKKFLKYLYQDISTKNKRNLYIAWLLRDLPGEFGVYMRRRWYGKLFKRCGDNLRILPGTIILRPEMIECGENVSFGVCNYIQAGGGLILGNDVMLGPYVKIWTLNHRYEEVGIPVHEQGYTYKAVRIGQDVWIGANAFVMPGTELGDKAVVAAHSVLSGKKYPERSILAGHPARRIGERGYANARW